MKRPVPRPDLTVPARASTSAATLLRPDGILSTQHPPTHPSGRFAKRPYTASHDNIPTTRTAGWG